MHSSVHSIHFHAFGKFTTLRIIVGAALQRQALVKGT